jgi:hypothetical protein
MILIPVFLILFASWMLWGWVVGESKDIKWMRVWFAPIFVVTAVLIAAGAGAGIAVVMVRQRVTHDVAELLDTFQQAIEAGRAAEVAQEIRRTDRSDDPDRDAFDLLKHLSVMQSNLKQTQQVASESSGEPLLR